MAEIRTLVRNGLGFHENEDPPGLGHVMRGIEIRFEILYFISGESMAFNELLKTLDWETLAWWLRTGLCAKRSIAQNRACDETHYAYLFVRKMARENPSFDLDAELLACRRKYFRGIMRGYLQSEIRIAQEEKSTSDTTNQQPDRSGSTTEQVETVLEELLDQVNKVHPESVSKVLGKYKPLLPSVDRTGNGLQTKQPVDTVSSGAKVGPSDRRIEARPGPSNASAVPKPDSSTNSSVATKVVKSKKPAASKSVRSEHVSARKDDLSGRVSKSKSPTPLVASNPGPSKEVPASKSKPSLTESNGASQNRSVSAMPEPSGHVSTSKSKTPTLLPAPSSGPSKGASESKSKPANPPTESNPASPGPIAATPGPSDLPTASQPSTEDKAKGFSASNSKPIITPTESNPAPPDPVTATSGPSNPPTASQPSTKDKAKEVSASKSKPSISSAESKSAQSNPPVTPTPGPSKPPTTALQPSTQDRAKRNISKQRKDDDYVPSASESEEAENQGEADGEDEADDGNVPKLPPNAIKKKDLILAPEKWGERVWKVNDKTNNLIDPGMPPYFGAVSKGEDPTHRIRRLTQNGMEFVVRDPAHASCPCGRPDNWDTMIGCDAIECHQARKGWWHMTCANLKEELGEDDKWYCWLCKPENYPDLKFEMDNWNSQADGKLVKSKERQGWTQPAKLALYATVRKLAPFQKGIWPVASKRLMWRFGLTRQLTACPQNQFNRHERQATGFNERQDWGSLRATSFSEGARGTKRKAKPEPIDVWDGPQRKRRCRTVDSDPTPSPPLSNGNRRGSKLYYYNSKIVRRHLDSPIDPDNPKDSERGVVYDRDAMRTARIGRC